MGPESPRLLVTGASGYIGARLVELATERGIDVIVLGTPPPVQELRHAHAWRLGDRPPEEALRSLTAVIHLAHSWDADSECNSSSGNINLVGSEVLARASFAAQVSRFVFASTTSARPTALNSYGRIKHLTETRLMKVPQAGQRLICARIGLVYGGPERGQYGLMSKLVRLAPVLPMFGLDREVQPIHLDEVCEGLLALALGALPGEGNGLRRAYVLAGPEPVTFGAWLRTLRRALTGRGIILLPVPVSAALLACDLTRIIPFLPVVDRERVLGLASTEPMASAADLSALGIKIVDPSIRLADPRAERRRMVAEAAAMLDYVSRGKIRSRSAVGRLVRGIDRDGGGRSLGLPRFVLGCPSFLRAFEPLRRHRGHRLAERLHLAAMVIESAQRGPQRSSRNFGSILGQAVTEAVALPFRLILGGRFQ
jgi:nucleoside-diphosphate-sugar epimerase